MLRETKRVGCVVQRWPRRQSHSIDAPPNKTEQKGACALELSTLRLCQASFLVAPTRKHRDTIIRCDAIGSVGLGCHSRSFLGCNEFFHDYVGVLINPNQLLSRFLISIQEPQGRAGSLYRWQPLSVGYMKHGNRTKQTSGV